MNKFFGIGRLTKDPEIRETLNSKKVGRFTIAINRPKEGTDFINCIAFDKTAETIGKYFKKASLIALEGHITTGSYEDKDGKKVYTTDVTVERFDFVDKKSATDTNVATNKSEESKASNLDNKPFEEMGEKVQSEQCDLPF